MQAVHGFLFSHNDNSSPKLTLPPLIADGKPMLKSMEWLSVRATTPPAFLEPQPQTTMDQQHDAIRHPRPHRLSLSSLSSISTDGSFEDDQTQGPSGTFDHYSETNKSQRDMLSLPALVASGNSRNDTLANQRQHAQTNQSNEEFTSATLMDHPPHVATALDQGRRRFGSLSPRSENLDGNSSLQQHQQSQDHHLTTVSSSSSTVSDSAPSPSSPLPASLMTFWALPTSTNNEQQHEFVTKNAHIKRPRNAWIHFRCYFGQSLKAKDPTIRAEEISKRASEYWSRLTSKQKKPWHVMAEQEKLAHQEAFPDYRYRPKRALPKSVVLSYPTTTTPPSSTPPLTCDLDHCSKKFRLA